MNDQLIDFLLLYVVQLIDSSINWASLEASDYFVKKNRFFVKPKWKLFKFINETQVSNNETFDDEEKTNSFWKCTITHKPKKPEKFSF